jgi:hypothetical protein
LRKGIGPDPAPFFDTNIHNRSLDFRHETIDLFVTR